MIGIDSTARGTSFNLLSLSVLLIGATIADAQYAPVQRFSPQEYAPYYQGNAAPSYYYPQNYYAPQFSLPPSPRLFAPLPATSAPNCSRNFPTADSVWGSSPYPTACPSLACRIASNTSGCTTALLSLAKLRIGFMTDNLAEPKILRSLQSFP